MTSKALLNKDELNKLSLPDDGVSALPDATIPLSGTELIPVIQSGTSKKITLEKLVPDVSTAASGEPLNTTATDKITTAAEAAQFLRQAALGGGTWSEIQEVLALGSRKDWLTQQIYTPDALRSSPIWNTSDPTLPAPGYFSNVCRTLFAPRGNGGTQGPPAFVFPGNTFTARCLLTAFLNNVNEDPLALPMHIAVQSVPGDNGGAGQPYGADPLETLRLKCTWVLSKFIPCSVPGGAWDAPDKTVSISMWYSLLHRAAFGTYADLLEDVTYSPPMALMLTYVANRKEADGFQPDENYAREIMQLFTIGLYELNIDGTYKLDANGDRIQTYDNEDVYQMARVFTGLVRMDRADGDQNKHNAAGNTSDWQWGTYLTYFYEHDTPAIRTEMSYTPLTGGIHAYCSYDGNITYGAANLRTIAATTTVAIAASGEITTVTVNSTTGFPPIGDIQIDDEIFHYNSITATTFGIYATTKLGNPAETTRRGHMLSTIGAHPIGSTVKYWKPYWYEPGVSAKMRHYLPFYEFGAKYALKGWVNIPANTEPRQNIRMAIEALVAHPSTAPFVCKNLIKHMVTSNPTPGYVARVARVFEDDGQGVRGNLGAVWMAILTDPEACNTTKSSQRFGRIRDSFELFAATVRPFHRVSRGTPRGSTNANSVWVNQVYQSNIFTGFLNTWSDIGVPGPVIWPYMAPSIFGYYPPDYQVAPGAGWGLTTPELGSYSFFTLMSSFNQIIARLVGGEPRDSPHSTVTISVASPAVVSWPDHQLANGTTLQLSTTGTLPTGLSPFTTYFVVNATANNFQLATAANGTPINTTAAGSGTHTAWAGILANASVDASHYTLITTSYDPVVSATASADDLVERLNLLMCGGNLSTLKKLGLPSEVSSNTATRIAQQDRITGVAQLLMYTPEFFTQ